MALKRLRVFSTTWEAGIAQSVLAGEGINSLVEDAIANSILPYMPSALEGVKLLVEESEFERAAQVLAEWDASTPLEESEETDAEPGDQAPDDGKSL